MKIRMRNIFLVAGSEYVKWLVNPRMIMIFVLCIPVREMIIVPMIKAAGEISQPLNIVETCVAATNSGLLLMLLPVTYFVLIAAFPTMEGNTFFYISRMGRKNWILGEILFQFMASFSFCVIVIVITAVQTVNISFAANGWSIAATDYDKLSDGLSGIHMRQFIPPNLFYQMTPYKAFFLSLTLLVLFITLCSVFLMLGCVCNRKMCFFILLCIQLVAGYALCELERPFMWLLPFRHMVLSMHYQEYMRKYVFPPGLSAAVFIVLIGIVTVVAYQKAKKASLDRM